MTTYTPQREQQMHALKAADQIRLARAALKRKLRTQQTSLSEILSEPCLQTAEVLDMLEAQWNWGKATALSCLARLESEGVRIKSNTYIGSLSERQFNALRASLPQAPAPTERQGS